MKFKIVDQIGAVFAMVAVYFFLIFLLLDRLFTSLFAARIYVPKLNPEVSKYAFTPRSGPVTEEVIG